MNSLGRCVLGMTMIVAAIPARAQDGLPSTQGVFLGAHYAQSWHDVGGQMVSFSGGRGISAGFGYDERWSLRFSADGGSASIANGGTYQLTNYNLAWRMDLVGAESSVRPYVALGLSAWRIGADNTSQSAGGLAPVFGGGIQLFVTPLFAIGGEFLTGYHVSGSQLTIGASLHLFGR